MPEPEIDPSRGATPMSQPPKSRAALWFALAIIASLAILVAILSNLNQHRQNAASSATFDPCRELRSMDPHCGWNPHWEHSGGSVSAIDGTKSEFLEVESSDADGTDYGNLHYAVLRLCFENGILCRGNTVKIGITVHGMVAPVDVEREYNTPVRVRFDDNAPVRRVWGISDDREAIFPHGTEKQFASELLKHKKIVVEFSYFEKAPRTISFEIAGLDSAMRSHGLKF